jgi:hypothetical protein
MSFIKFISYKNGLLIHSFFLISVNIILTQLPLTSTFGYEFAAINGLMLTVIAGLHTFNFISKSEFAPTELIKNLLILFLIPFVITIINSMLTMFCSFIDGLSFYLLIVSASIMFGVAIAIIVRLNTKRFNRLIFFIIIILIALIPILEIYFYPQVYFYSPLIGFFPGNIYDEGLTTSWKLFFHQILVISFSITIIFLFIKRTTLVLKYKKYFILSIVVTAISFQFMSSLLGFTTTFSKLDSTLSKRIESKSFILHYDNVDSTLAKLIALNQEYYYSQLFTALQTKPSKKINVYLFNNRKQKKIIFGAGNADVAKPWQYSIYISADSWQNTLKHELAHVFTAEFGSGIFKIASAFNPALIEGMAESLDGISNDISINDLTVLAFNNGYVIDIKSLFTGMSFFKSNSMLAYTFSGSFIQYLTKKYGIEKVKMFYGNGEFETIFKTKIDTEQKDFEESINNPDLTAQKTMADYYFGRLSIIQKVCPRYIGARLNNAYEVLVENNYEDAESIFKEINQKTLNYSSLIGLSDIYYKQNKINKAIQLILNDYNKFKATPYYHNMIFRLGDLYALNFEYDSASIWYNKIVKDSPNHQLNYLSNTRLSLIEYNKLQEYLDGSDSLKLEVLISLNNKIYNYGSLPIIIDLLRNQNIDYKKSLSIFNKTFIVDNIQSSYAAFKLSQFMLDNNDYVNARKYAALSLRFKNGNLFFSAMQEQFEKAIWFFKNSN